MEKRKIHWNRSESFSASDSFAVSSEKAIFLLESLDKGDICRLEDSQLDSELILVDTSWHWIDTELLCAGAQQVVGACIGSDLALRQNV